MEPNINIIHPHAHQLSSLRVEVERNPFCLFSTSDDDYDDDDDGLY